MRRGNRVPGPEPLSVPLDLASEAGGRAWAHPLPATTLGDSLDNPIRSPLALFEDEILLGPPHTAHDLIREEGGGAYSHWGDTLYFSTTDGDGPKGERTSYRAVIPLPELDKAALNGPDLQPAFGAEGDGIFVERFGANLRPRPSPSDAQPACALPGLARRFIRLAFALTGNPHN